MSFHDTSASGLEAVVRLVNRDQRRAVAEVARAVAADLVVVGKRPNGAVTDTLLDQTATHLVRRPPCPVLVVPTS